MSYTEAARKRSTAHLRGYLKKHHNIDLGSARAHELVAAVIGFNSVAALKSRPGEVLDPRYPDEFDLEDNSESVDAKLKGMGRSAPELLSMLPLSDDIARVTANGLKPACDNCGSFFDSHRIEGQDGDEDLVWVCSECAINPDTKLAICAYCDPARNIHLFSTLEPDGLCPDHREEMDMDEEELGGWMDYVENITKDG